MASVQEYDASSSYIVGEYVKYSTKNALYRCNQDTPNPAGTFDEDYWTLIGYLLDGEGGFVKYDGDEVEVDYERTDNVALIDRDEVFESKKSFKKPDGASYKDLISFVDIQNISGTEDHRDMNGYDTAEKRLGIVRFIKNASNNRGVELIAVDSNDGEQGKISILRTPDNKNVITRSTQPANDKETNSLEIPTVGWVNTTGDTTNNIVHKSGNETIDDTKTYTSDIIRSSNSEQYPAGVIVKRTSLAGNYSVPSSDFNAVVAGERANDGTYLGYFSVGKSTSGNTTSRIMARNRNSSTATEHSESISVTVRNDGTYFTSAPIPTTTNSTTEKQIATTGWVNDPSARTNVVHKTGNESITGLKTFEGGVFTHFKDANNEIGTFSSDQWSTSCLQFLDKNGVRIGRIQPSYITGTNITQMGIWASNGSSSGSSESGIRVRSNGEAFAPRPSNSNSTSNNNIATTGWVNDPTASTNVVHRSGTESINGEKNFYNHIYRVSTNDHFYNVGTNNYTSLYFRDKSGEVFAACETFEGTNGDNVIQLNIKNGDSASNWNWSSCALSLGVRRDKSTYALAPHPANNNQNDNSIATTKWVKDILQAIYPVGSIYIGTTASCPLASFFGTWTQIQGRYLLASGTIAGSTDTFGANSYASAGLPDVYGSYSATRGNNNTSGAFAYISNTGGQPWDGRGLGTDNMNFYASRVSSVYGQSSTVRPAAYVVNVWRRTA